jgi:hypothetical protein
MPPQSIPQTAPLAPPAIEDVRLKARHAVESIVKEMKNERKDEKWVGGLFKGIRVSKREQQGNQKERDGGEILREGWL